MRWSGISTVLSLDDRRAAVYAPHVTSQALRLLSLLDREPQSISYGSFDREHWGWMFRDFPITMLQAAVYPVALLWRFPFPDDACYANTRVLGWIEAALASICARQRPNGAFDSVGPFTQDHGVTLAMVYVLTETARLLGEQVSPPLRNAIERVVRAGCEFAASSREDYAFISNHQALFALAFLNAHAMLGEGSYRAHASRIIEQILRRQSAEGWYREYDGADPGYESLGIFYLATYWNRTHSEALLSSLRKSLEFYAHFIHPDGSVGGMYGSRHTSLYFPAGFEILAPEVPIASAIARFMRARLTCHNVVTPAISDAENLAPLTYSYLEACLTQEPDVQVVQPLPCEDLDGVRHFADAGLSVIGTQRYYAVVSTSKGGICRVFDKASGNLTYEDAGYVATAGKRRWTSQLSGAGRRAASLLSNQVACTANLDDVKQELLTPTKFLLLRILNLTVFRSLTLGAWVRRLIIGRLITGKKRGPLRVTRVMTFRPDAIEFEDRLELLKPMVLDDVARPRQFTAIHMGSAKYAHPSELTVTPEPSAETLARELNLHHAASSKFTVRFEST